MGEYYRNNVSCNFYKGVQMKTVEEIKEELKRLENLYRYTNDASQLHQETYWKMQQLEWVLNNVDND